MKFRKVTCDETSCYLSKNTPIMDSQVGGFLDPNLLVPFSGGDSPKKRSKKRHNLQIGKGKKRSQSSTPSEATPRSKKTPKKSKTSKPPKSKKSKKIKSKSSKGKVVKKICCTIKNGSKSKKKKK
jgi:hypothetical protein